MILGPDGKLARLQTVPLSADCIRALVDGRHLVAELDGALRACQLEPVCLGCGGRVTGTLLADRFDFRCGHTSGYIRLDRGPLEVEQLLAACHWGIRCTKCLEPVVGDNGKGDPTFRVECSCTTREKANPLAIQPVASLAH